MYNKKEIEAANKLCGENLPKIFEIFKIKLDNCGTAFYGTCCVHNSDKNNSMAIYLNNGNPQWACFTKKCHKIFCGNMLGFVRGLLSHENGYANPGDPTYSFSNTIKWINQNLGDSPKSPIFSPSNSEPSIDIPIDEKCFGDFRISRQEARSRLNLPSPYMVSRGFSPQVLNDYDVGESKKYNPKTCWRAIVPIYNFAGTTCIGVTARSVFPECTTCNSHHDAKWPCPKESLRRMYSKWKNVGFRRRYSLYNYWKLPQKCKSLLIVESPGNVWRLVEAGFKNVVAIYGSYQINSFQEKLIKDKGVENLYLGFDNDEAGKEAFDINGKHLWSRFNIHKIVPTESDFAEMGVEVCKEKIIPQIKG